MVNTIVEKSSGDGDDDCEIIKLVVTITRQKMQRAKLTKGPAIAILNSSKIFGLFLYI